MLEGEDKLKKQKELPIPQQLTDLLHFSHLYSKPQIEQKISELGKLSVNNLKLRNIYNHLIKSYNENASNPINKENLVRAINMEYLEKDLPTQNRPFSRKNSLNKKETDREEIINFQGKKIKEIFISPIKSDIQERQEQLRIGKSPIIHDYSANMSSYSMGLFNLNQQVMYNPQNALNDDSQLSVERTQRYELLDGLKNQVNFHNCSTKSNSLVTQKNSLSPFSKLNHEYSNCKSSDCSFNPYRKGENMGTRKTSVEYRLSKTEEKGDNNHLSPGKFPSNKLINYNAKIINNNIEDTQKEDRDFKGKKVIYNNFLQNKRRSVLSNLNPNITDSSNIIALTSSKKKSKSKPYQPIGLKEISSKVKSIIRTAQSTSYKEISDQIVNEVEGASFQDTKNIRRRIYDALNVLKALGLFSNNSEDSKSIIWNSDINDNENKEDLQKKIQEQTDTLQLKKEIKDSFLFKVKMLKNIIHYNKQRDCLVNNKQKIFPPYVVANYMQLASEARIIMPDEDNKRLHLRNQTPIAVVGDFDILKKFYLKLSQEKSEV